MSIENSTAILRFKNGKDSWTAPSDIVWKKILEVYLFEIADCFGIRGIASEDSLRRQTVFNFADLTEINFLRVKQYKPQTIALNYDPNKYIEAMALFELNKEAQRVLAFASFARLFIEHDIIGEMDEVCFFAGASLLAATVDSDVIFSNLNSSYYELLCAADTTIAKNLWTDFEMTTNFRPN